MILCYNGITKDTCEVWKMDKKSKEGNITDTVVDILVELRKQKHMTQQDIADATGMQRANVARIEGKRYTPTIDVLMRYAKCLGMEIKVSLKEKGEDCDDGGTECDSII